MEGDNGVLNIGQAPLASDLCVLWDDRPQYRTSQSDLDQLVIDALRSGTQGLLALTTYGRNGDESSFATYLLTGGPGGGPLYQLVNGSVFTSLESFNAVTMFSDAPTEPVAQGKLIDFTSIGGVGGVGFAFEPQSDAIVDTEFFFYNLVADGDGDGRADLTFIEAAFSGICYLSWAEVVLGDPLMRYAYNSDPNNSENNHLAWDPLDGDANMDNHVNLNDLWAIKSHLGGDLLALDENQFNKYYDTYDINQDGKINYADMWRLKDKINKMLEM